MKLLLLTLFVAVAAAVPLPDEEASGPVEVVVNGVPEGQALDIGHIVDIQMKEHVGGEVVAATNLLHPFTAVGIAEAAAAAAAAAAEDNQNEIAPEPVVMPSPVAPEVVPEPIVLPSPVAPEVALPEPVVLPSPVAPEVALPEAVVLPSPVAPEVVPEPVVLPSPVAPEVVPEPVVLPSPVAPEVVPEPVVLPSPAAPEVVPEPVVLPSPAAPEVAEELPAPAPQFPSGDIYNDGQVQVTVNGPEDPSVFSTLQGWFNMVINYFSEGVQTTHQIV